MESKTRDPGRYYLPPATTVSN